MPQVTYNGQSFAIDAKRVWVLGASVHYARIPAEQWGDRIAAARQAGFNTIETACPWAMHEPRKGRFTFEYGCDVRRFIELCADQGMMVILRPGPYIGGQYDGGGLPSWLGEIPDIRLRQANEALMECVTKYFRKLLSDLTDLQATKGGPILLVQAEHGWRCSNPSQTQHYLHEITRIIRESGIAVPVTSANDLWPEDSGTIEVWTGSEDLLLQSRQLRVVQPESPRLVTFYDPRLINLWGGKYDGDAASKQTLRRLAEILAAGGQPVMRPFHGGTGFGFVSGRLCGTPAGFVGTSTAPGSPLGEAGARGETYNAIRRLVTFANHFGYVFSDLDPDYHPISMDLGELGTLDASSGSARSKASGSARFSIVPQRGNGGRVVFVFAGEGSSSTTLILDDGLRMPVDLGDQPVGWYVFGVDLAGAGRLDYANLCPWAIIDRSIVVFQGPARMEVLLSVNGNPLDATVPAGKTPLVIRHKNLTFVICNQTQIDVAYHDDEALFVGVAGFDAEGDPVPAPGYSKAWVIRTDGQPRTVAVGADQSGSGGHESESESMSLTDWSAAPAERHVAGQSPRFASLDGPRTLVACGATEGYGWYRILLKSTATKKKLCQLPRAADRVHLFLDGEPAGLWGTAPGADDGPLELRLTKGEHVLTALVDNFGRFADGNDLARPTGLFGHIYEVKALKGGKGKKTTAEPVNPFDLRGFIVGCAQGQLSSTEQVVWSFTHAKKSPILVDVIGATVSGTFVLNDQPIEYYAGATGGCRLSLLLEPKEMAAFKRGKNELRFAPDARQEKAEDAIIKATTLYECIDNLSQQTDWSFAKWETPAAAEFQPRARAEAKALKGAPCWWRTAFELAGVPVPAWLDTTGLSKGQAYLNGRNLGRYFTATAAGRAVGPQKLLYVPEPWLITDGENELTIFDEHGFDPSRTKIIFSATGELE